MNNNAELIKKIFHYKPKKHFRTDLNKCQNGDQIQCTVKIINYLTFGKNKGIRILAIEKETKKSLSLIFFHRKTGFLYKIFAKNSEKTIVGRIQFFGNNIQITHPKVLTMQEIKKFQNIEYDGKEQQDLINLLHKVHKLEEWITSTMIKKFAFNDFIFSLKDYFLNNNAQPNSLERLAYDEILAFQLSLNIIEKKNKNYQIHSNNFSQELIKNMDFSLTNDQKQALQEIYIDQQKPQQMLRLLQGDVGSGKTIIALLTILNIVENNGQVALLAPTESLVRQHLEYIDYHLKKIQHLVDIKTTIIVSELSNKVKKNNLAQIKNGEVQIIIGTHALFFDAVEFHNLQLIIIDEQQRFGVLQRLRLAEKGFNPDILLLTATPIPRTEMIAKYGQISSSIIKEKPADRLPIKTTMHPVNKLSQIIKRLQQIVNQEKIFWVCPLIEESDFFQFSDVEKRFEYLKEFFHEQVAIIHGRMKNQEIQQKINDFQQGKIRLLVATSIIEVGIHVPDASIIIIENAERFGLSSLHQLRGRVGRGSKQSSCVLLHDDKLSAAGRQRLQTMCKSNDGFYIAQEDLKIRGAGEIFGQMQSGQQNFLFFDIKKHRHLLEAAKKQITNNIIDTKNRDLLLKIFSFENCVCF